MQDCYERFRKLHRLLVHRSSPERHTSHTACTSAQTQRQTSRQAGRQVLSTPACDGTAWAVGCRSAGQLRATCIKNMPAGPFQHGQSRPLRATELRRHQCPTAAACNVPRECCQHVVCFETPNGYQVLSSLPLLCVTRRHPPLAVCAVVAVDAGLVQSALADLALSHLPRCVWGVPAISAALLRICCW
jgi:hypothetical protein